MKAKQTSGIVAGVCLTGAVLLTAAYSLNHFIGVENETLTSEAELPSLSPDNSSIPSDGDASGNLETEAGTTAPPDKGGATKPEEKPETGDSIPSPSDEAALVS